MKLIPGGVLVLLGLSCSVSCVGHLQHPSSESDERRMQRPEAVTAFNLLYQKNCAGCHGTDGRNGAATDLANPTYQALIDDTTLRDITANGQKGTMMPGFAKSAGGDLTDAQIDALVQGMRKQWRRAVAAQPTPPYKATAAGNVDRGRQVYVSDCARCHGREAGPPGKAGAILDHTFLDLVSDQTVRTTAIAGRPDLGMPDFRNQIRGGHALSDQDVTDVVSFVLSRRTNNAGISTNSQSPSPANTSSSQFNAQGRP